MTFETPAPMMNTSSHVKVTFEKRTFGILRKWTVEGPFLLVMTLMDRLKAKRLKEVKE